MHDLSRLGTEQSNPKTANLDELQVEQVLRIMNEEDATVPLAVREVIPAIAEAVRLCVSAIEHGGRVLYVGAGTSGRLAAIDASEIPTTFGVGNGLFMSFMAGGARAIVESVEGAEDSHEDGYREMVETHVCSTDVVVGLTASGRTPYVRGALEAAAKAGAATVLICNVEDADIRELPDIVIAMRTGPEILTGSTRLKAGTSQKLVLNMISTATMVKLGRVFGNWMVGLEVLNDKLLDRARRIVENVTGVSEEEAINLLESSGKKVELAILMGLSDRNVQDCQEALSNSQNNIRKALKLLFRRTGEES